MTLTQIWKTYCAYSVITNYRHARTTDVTLGWWSVNAQSKLTRSSDVTRNRTTKLSLGEVKPTLHDASQNIVFLVFEQISRILADCKIIFCRQNTECIWYKELQIYRWYLKNVITAPYLVKWIYRLVHLIKVRPALFSPAKWRVLKTAVCYNIVSQLE